MPCSAAMAEFEVDVMGYALMDEPEVGEKRTAEEELCPVKRLRPGGWTEETPPPSPPSSSDDESDDDGEEGEHYPGSILASCLLSDKRTGGGFGPAEPEPQPYGGLCEMGRVQGHAAAAHGYAGWGYHGDGGFQRPPQNQTVECDGKSYIQLGAVPPRRERSQFYRYQRFTALHATMLKLSRHRRMMDPLLRKSVLLFNTMRHIERELEQEGLSLAAAFNPHHFDSGPLTLDPPPQQLPPPPPPPAPVPLPMPASDEINWGSVLSLGSQPELEILPAEAPPPAWHLAPLCADDVLRPAVPERRDEPEPVSLLAL